MNNTMNVGSERLSTEGSKALKNPSEGRSTQRPLSGLQLPPLKIHTMAAPEENIPLNQRKIEKKDRHQSAKAKSLIPKWVKPDTVNKTHKTVQQPLHRSRAPSLPAIAMNNLSSSNVAEKSPVKSPRSLHIDSTTPSPRSLNEIKEAMDQLAQFAQRYQQILDQLESSGSPGTSEKMNSPEWDQLMKEWTSVRKIIEKTSLANKIKEDKIDTPRFKSILNFFGKYEPSSKNPPLTSSKSSVVASIPNISLLGINGSSSFYSKEQNLAKSPRSSNSILSNISPRSIDRVKESVQLLSQFAQQHQFNFDQTEASGSELPAQVTEKQCLGNELLDDWMVVRQMIDDIMDFKDEDDDLEIDRRRSISFRNLGWDREFDATESLHYSKKDKHLVIARTFLSKFKIDLSTPDSNKLAKKASQLNIPFTTFHQTLFHYIEGLVLLGKTLQHTSFLQHIINPNNLEDKHSVWLYAAKFIEKLEKIDYIKKQEESEKIRTIKECCNECGRCLIEYVRTLANGLNQYLYSLEESKPFRQYLSLIGWENDLKSILTTKFCRTFEADFTRAVKGKFLLLTLNSEQMVFSVLPDQIQLDPQEELSVFNSYCRDFLTLLIEHLHIDLNVKPQEFNPLIYFNEKGSIEKVYQQLEENWQIQLEQNAEAKMEGSFKLLPLFRAFNQALLLSTSYVTLLTDKFLTEIQSNKILREFNLPDWETKKIQFDFNSEKNAIFIIIERLAALEDTKTNSFFPSSKIKTSTRLTAPLADPQNWSITRNVEIEYPKDLIQQTDFFHRLATLITILETLKLSYTITEL